MVSAGTLAVDAATKEWGSPKIPKSFGKPVASQGYDAKQVIRQMAKF
jgi:hypothetical protein